MFIRNKIIFLLIASVIIAVFFHIFKPSFPCINSDEAAFGYNTFSILKTGADEYGKTIPLRLKSFGENKLPMMAYLSLPFVGIMGLNEYSTRMVIGLIGILTPLLLYFLVKEITEKKSVAVIAAILGSMSPWIQIASRHAHEAVLAYAFTILSLLFFFKYIKTNSLKNLLLCSVFNGLALFSHHNAKIFTPLLLLFFAVHLFTSNTKNRLISSLKLFAILLLPVVIFLISEFVYPTNRISNLVFTNNAGFSLTINELRGELNNPIIYNKATQAALTFTSQYISYFSPEFLVIKGDENPRFGYPGISPITPIEYLFIGVGLYYLFKLNERNRWYIVAILLASPLTAALSWQEHSLTRAFFMIVPIIALVSYGIIHAYHDAKNYRLLLTVLTVGAFAFFLFYTWMFYFYHYPKRPLVIRAWQCGYRELGQYVKDNYANFDTFYISKQHGQPYIYILYYLGFNPAQYQKEAALSAPDRYGFGQVERFDKFNFSFAFPPQTKKAVYIGYPDDFTNQKERFKNLQNVKKIKVGTEEIFWIYEKVT